MTNPGGREVSRIDLAARSLDLTTALLKATTSSESLLQGAWEVGQWLGRERLNQYELLDCMERARGLVHANHNGHAFFDKVIKGQDMVPVAPLFLQQSGSLGRLMAGDGNLSWIVSTVACLFQHTRDEQAVTAKLTAFIMEGSRCAHAADGSQPIAMPHDPNLYNPDQTRLRAVVRKIVLSVWYNVVNAGCDTLSLPDELVAVCPRGHALDPADFAIVINTVLHHCRTKAILRTSHLLRDVVLWLLLHYDGSIVVNVGGEIVHRVNVASSPRELEIHVTSSCPEDGPCSDSGESYKILRHISGSFNDFLSGYSFGDESSQFPLYSGVRQKLYDVPRPYSQDSVMWNRSNQILVKQTAQAMMRWLLGRQQLPFTSSSQPGFRVDPDSSAAVPTDAVQFVLKRVPEIVNLVWGSSSVPNVVVCAPAEQRRQPSTDVNSYPAPPQANHEHRLGAICRTFPILEDLGRRVSADCKCYSCNMPRGLRDWITDGIKHGCLMRIAMTEVFLLLGHAVADALGVNDVSSMSDPRPIETGVVQMLFELTEENALRWDTWFMLASCVYLGCPFESPTTASQPAFGGTAFAAIQYGNLATQAPWLDLSKELTIQGCFGLVGSPGRLGVMTRSAEQHPQFRSVEENFAIIETENTEDTSPFCSRVKKPSVPMDQTYFLREDGSAVDSDVILCQMDDKFYRLLLRIKTNNHWRIVDPSDAICAAMRSLPMISCSHSPNAASNPLIKIKPYTLDEVVGRWTDTVQSTTAEKGADSDDAVFHVSEILDSHLKTNIALALSVCTVAVLNDSKHTCPTCAIEHAKALDRAPLRKGESGPTRDRYIINVSSELLWQNGSRAERFITDGGG